MSALTLEVFAPGYNALVADRNTLEEFHAWLKSAPDPLRADTTCIELIDATTFRCTHWVKDHAGKYILDGKPCPEDSIHPIGYRCRFCEQRRVRQAVTVVATSAPIPPTVLRYFTPSSAEGTPQ